MEYTGENNATDISTIVLNSYYRDRTIHPNPCDYTVELGNNFSQDKYFSDMPWYVALFVVTDAANKVIAPIVSYTDYHSSDQITIHGEDNNCDTNFCIDSYVTVFYDTNVSPTIGKVTSFLPYGSSTTFTPYKMTIDVDDSTLYADDRIFLCAFHKTLPILNGFVSALVDTRHIILPVGASAVDNYYKGMWIWTCDNLHVLSPKRFSYSYAMINSYVASTRTITFDRDITSSNYFEIAGTVKYNHQPAVQTSLKHYAEYYNVRLLSLIIPNSNVVYFSSPKYGYIYTYRYLIVHIGNERRSLRGDIVAANIMGEFIIPTNNLLPSAGGSRYILSDCYMDMMIKLDLTLPIYFSLYTPDGEIIDTTEREYYAPYEPNYFNQTVAIFRLVKDCNTHQCSLSEKKVVALRPNDF